MNTTILSMDFIRQYQNGEQCGYSSAQGAQSGNISPSIAQRQEHSSAAWMQGFRAGCAQWAKDNADM